jgi:hypothetical protein
MDESTWLSCTDTRTMLDALEDQATDRKLRLFACACCRRIWPMLNDERSRQAVLRAEQYADGRATVGELEIAWEAARTEDDGGGCQTPRELANDAAAAASYTAARNEQAGAELCSFFAAAAVSRVVDPTFNPNPGWNGPGTTELISQCRLLRDIFGNPFKPVAINRSWLTSTVVSLAQAIYDERAFDRLPVLADALEESGCTSQEMLEHCRGGGEHVRGCWCLDLILGKE